MCNDNKGLQKPLILEKEVFLIGGILTELCLYMRFVVKPFVDQIRQNIFVPEKLQEQCRSK